MHVLGQGGMGTVFMAHDLRLKGRSCVVKKLRDDFYREEDRQKAQAFFEREMQVLADLRHQNIVQILDFFTEGDDYYLVMEYVQGNNLHNILHDERHGEPFPEKTVVQWAEQICSVLRHLHSQSPPIIYRDLKPSNIMITENNQIKLVDFGIARTFEEKADNTHVVSAGYSPPEQYWGAADPRSDIYSLGATMHFMLTGRDPEALHVCIPKSLNAGVSDKIDAIVQMATAQDPAERYASAEEMREALIALEVETPADTTRNRFVEVAVVVSLLALAAIMFVVEPLLETDPKKGTTHTFSGNTDDTIDSRNTREVGHTSASGASGNATDLAVQMMDEKDLTDPEALPASRR